MDAKLLHQTIADQAKTIAIQAETIAELMQKVGLVKMAEFPNIKSKHSLVAKHVTKDRWDKLSGRPWWLLRWLQDLRPWLRPWTLLRLRCPRCCPCCEHLRRRPCRLSRRRPRRRVPRRPRRGSRHLQLRPGLPLRLSLHRWHCSRRHPRCRRCLRRCWTLRRQLRWNRPCCQEGGRG